VEALNLQPGDIGIDCTMGAGGHTALMADQIAPDGKIYGVDRDQQAHDIASMALASQMDAGLIELVKSPFSDLQQMMINQGIEGQVQGICADIGVSSMHLDQPERGFSFMTDGPLDMRMDPSQGPTAADLIQSSTEDALARIFRDYGDEPKAKWIAKCIVKARNSQPFETTLQLADFIKENIHYRSKSKKHPATRVFQALRISVNNELEELKTLLQVAFDGLRAGGRLAIISFHSLEDRIVKKKFLDLTAQRERSQLPRDIPLRDEQLQTLHRPLAKILKPFPTVPSDEEISANPRARSAKLRVIEKCEEV
jgi:16S rRNA (cytosine1402-N4)-methyltransferase